MLLRLSTASHSLVRTLIALGCSRVSGGLPSLRYHTYLSRESESPPMFGGSGHQISGGTFYNVGGDVNLQTHQHLTIQDHRPVSQLDDGRTPGSHQPLMIRNNGDDATSRRRISGIPASDVQNTPSVASSSFLHTDPLPLMPNPLSRYSATHLHPHSDCTRTRVNLPVGTDRQPTGPGRSAAALDDDRLEGGHLTQYHRAFRLPPMLSTQGGTFFSANNLNTAENIIHNHRHGETGIHILHRAVALEALYDSADSFPQPKCHPETRIKLLDDLCRWATQNDPAQPICWLHGPAGAGKSAVMQTMRLLFKRGHAMRGNSRALFVTLAYQLALNNRKLNPLISQIVKHDPSIVGRLIDAQLHQLIIEACKLFKDSVAPILLVNGLDECDTHDAQVEVLRLIGHVVRQHTNIFRIIIASRPEAHIRDSLEGCSFAGILHSVNVEQSFNDVRTFLRNEFARIHRDHKHTMEGVPTPWPSADILEELVLKSSGYFVYASTVVKFVNDKYFYPIERLAAVVELLQTPSEMPFAALDQLYIQILSGVPPRFRLTLGDILQGCALLSWLASEDIEKLLELRPGVVHLILCSLHSVIDVTGRIYAYHASFWDFLQDPQRSSIFCLKLENRMNVTRAVIRTLSSHYGNLFIKINVTDLIACLKHIPPSAELVPLICGVNPDYLFLNFDGGLNSKKVLAYLKASQPVPEVQCWETYHLMYSWQNLLALPPGQGMKKQTLGGILAILTLSWEQDLARGGCLVAINLARGCLRHIQRIGFGHLVSWRYSNKLAHLNWGQLIRCSPYASPELLQELREFVPRWESFLGEDKCLCSVEFHDTVQWLKVNHILHELPEPPLDLIERWQGYLIKSQDTCQHYWWNPYEKRWQESFSRSMSARERLYICPDQPKDALTRTVDAQNRARQFTRFDALAFAWKRTGEEREAGNDGGSGRRGARGPRGEGTDEEVDEMWRGAAHAHRAQAERDEPGLRGEKEQGSGWRRGGKERSMCCGLPMCCAAECGTRNTIPCRTAYAPTEALRPWIHSTPYHFSSAESVVGSNSPEVIARDLRREKYGAPEEEVGRMYAAPTGTLAGSGSREAAHDSIGSGPAGSAQACSNLGLYVGWKRLH
ncbi:hypothetical protein B0H14DRAFT_3720397 [Mycena olivaceomarginata]|nr:hypothetical protein B0H14DRAFT_3720397 [Mycena olivaceomarginata]